MVAILDQQTHIIPLLVDENPDMDIQDGVLPSSLPSSPSIQNLCTALHYASRSGDADIVSRVLTKRLHINIQDNVVILLLNRIVTLLDRAYCASLGWSPSQHRHHLSTLDTWS
jgi:hypothetical protein